MANMTKTVAILQSNFIPWRGYFDLISRCDLFIVGDVVQYTRRDWRNRNLIKTPTGTQWLTVPIQEMPRSTTSIDQARVSGKRWLAKHIRSLTYNYGKAAGYKETAPWLFGLLETIAGEEELLSRVNTRLLRSIADRLGITTPIVQSSDILPRAELLAIDKNMRTLALCQEVGATCYLSGPAAKVYLNVQRLADHGIDVSWMSYDGYRDYPQLWGAFEPRVSIVDLMFNTGAAAGSYVIQEPATVGEAGRAIALTDDVTAHCTQLEDKASVASAAPGE